MLWFQLLDYAKQEKKPVIFVCDDRKDDWWYRHQGKTVSPRPELVQEMQTVASASFYMYSPERFMEYAETFLKLAKQPEVIEEVRGISQGLPNFQIVSRRTYSPMVVGDSVRDWLDVNRMTALADYGWTEFWSWARAKGFNDRKTLDAVVGRPTNGMTPLEIRRAIEGLPPDTRQAEWNELIAWLQTIGISSRYDLELSLGGTIENMTPAEVKAEVLKRNIDIQF